ncbi:MAG: acylphosphatase [Roseibacillus sp.]|jgi:acylphosphatase|nr:acylphosphatase [Roseibacillus sp.]MBP35091.1 acylphosphatase [Roseibacillus sp.]MCP4732408.1 acylphosphatase [Roseibacillus sp.]MDP6206725.1 acylphosphatase [Roseibacillus sp.]MDP7308285.1 acylphosphatase [Roseibacillus sp.]|tara:strand:+ start:3516 stop:3791 length:276 start_codon:yes stop_codon:yes gene_type:complete
MTAKRVLFSGRVQGVGFRYTTREIATGFDVVGAVRNLPDGTVELEIMGETDELEAYLAEITEESPVAHFIKEVQIEEIALLENARGFRITR